MRFKWAALLTIGLILTARVWADDKSDRKAMEGDWSTSAAEMAGQKLPDEVIKSIKLTMKDDKYVVKVGENSDEGTVKVDSTKKPKEMDIVGGEGPNKGKTFLAIYDLKGDTLKVCYDLEGKERPKEFTTKENTRLFLATYQRIKKASGQN